MAVTIYLVSAKTGKILVRGTAVVISVKRMHFINFVLP